MSLNRRQFLKWSSKAPLLASAPLLFSSQSASALTHSPKEEFRQLKLNNLHTGEKANVTYWEQGEYVIDALADIYLLMRDHRENSIAPIDIRLLDQLHHVQQKLESQKEILLVSGYRSPKTNENLRKSNHSVSRNSLHMKGKAMDFLIPGLNLRHVHKATLASSAGGVGYYARSGFIHMDTGRKRRWNL
ncbi:MAG: DUF882 domain-containing protein [Bermanella sp.]